MAFENISRGAMIPPVSGAQFDPGMTGITIRKDRKEMVMLVRGNEARMRAKPKRR